MVSVRQVKAARALLGWSQGDLAEKSGVSAPTIARLEASDNAEVGGRKATATAIVAALETAGVRFIQEGQKVAGVLYGEQDR